MSVSTSSFDPSSDGRSLERVKGEKLTDGRRQKTDGRTECSRVSDKPTKYTISGGKKRRVCRRVDKGSVSGKDSEPSSGMGVRRGRASLKRVNASSEPTVRPPE
jgi:hypothetical protein